MRKNLALLFVSALLLTNISANVGFCLPAIPNAPFQQGFGIDTPAGSGRHLGTPSTTIYKVTNLNDSGPGSLREGLVNQNGPKTIVFEVSGTIELESGITIGSAGSLAAQDAENWGSYITIAGQTAPSPGITIKGKSFKIDRLCHDILIQHIRFRSGDKNLVAEQYESWDSFITDMHYDVGRGWTPPYNIVIDHCSFSWAVDEIIESGADNMTFINNIVSEGLNSPLHPKGPHSKGFLGKSDYGEVAGNQNVICANNLFSHNVDRNPRWAGGAGVISNNLIYDYKFGLGTTDAGNNGRMLVSIVGNYLVETATTEQWSMYIVAGTYAGSRIYLGPDNYWDGQLQTDPWNATGYFRSCDIWTPCSNPVPLANRASLPLLWPTGYTAMSAADARTYVLANAGARPADRDSVDTRVISQAQNELCASGCIIVSQDDVGGWPILAENTHTLEIPSNPTEIQPSGYTKLEEWLHGFSRAVEGETVTGDITGDSLINIQDIQACVNHILGTQDWGSVADVNKDDAVNVLDVQAIVNIILQG